MPLFWVIVLVLYLLLLAIGCLDRGCTEREVGGKANRDEAPLAHDAGRQPDPPGRDRHQPTDVTVSDNTRTSSVPRPLPTLEQIRALAVLTTVRTEIADVCEFEIRGRTGGVKALFLVQGTALIGVDLERARFAVVDPDQRRAVLELPQPAVQAARLDHDRTRLAMLQSTGLWAIVPGGGHLDAQVVERGLREAQERVEAAAGSPHLAERARHQAEVTIGGLFSSLGWTVECRWLAP